MSDLKDDMQDHYREGDGKIHAWSCEPREGLQDYSDFIEYFTLSMKIRMSSFYSNQIQIFPSQSN